MKWFPLISVSSPILGVVAVSCTVFAILLGLSPDLAMAKTLPENEPDTNQLLQGKAYVYKLDPDGSAGKGYKFGIYGRCFLESLLEIQNRYFDFFGATLWMNYPWYGGMRHYLHYTARWEQETITRLIDQYR